MKLLSVNTGKTKQSAGEEFLFDRPVQGSLLRLEGGAALAAVVYVGFCGGPTDIDFDIEIKFEHDGQYFRLLRKVGANTPSVVLRKIPLESDGKEPVAARGEQKVKEYLTSLLGAEISSVVGGCFADNGAFRRLCVSDNLRNIPAIDKLFKMIARVEAAEKDAALLQSQSTLSALMQKDKERMRLVEQLQKAARERENLLDNITKLRSRKAYLTAKSESAGAQIVRGELEGAEQHRDALLLQREQIARLAAAADRFESDRDFYILSAEIKKLEPEVSALAPKIAALKSEADWIAKQQEEINAQLEEKQSEEQFASAESVRANQVSAELERAKELEAANAEIESNLSALRAEKEKLENNREELRQTLADAEKAALKLKSEMSTADVSAEQLEQTLETVRKLALLEENTEHIERLQNEIGVKESMLTQKELSVQTRSRQLLAIRSADEKMTLLKARDGINNILDMKIARADSILKSFNQKLQNCERASEKLTFELAALEQSHKKLLTERSRLIAKREAFSSRKQGQNTSDEKQLFDAAQLEEIETECLNRRAAISRAEKQLAYISGISEECRRQIEIEKADKAACLGEKSAVAQQFLLLTSQNDNEVVHSYIRALETDKGTKYLLSVQQSYTREETELNELKKSLESSKARLAEAHTRRAALIRTAGAEMALRDEDEAADESMRRMSDAHTKHREQLREIAGRYTDALKKQNAVDAELGKLDLKIARTADLITEGLKTIRLNEREIESANAKATALADGNVERALKYSEAHAADVAKERKTLFATKLELETSLFEKRLEESLCRMTLEDKRARLIAAKERIANRAPMSEHEKEHGIQDGTELAAARERVSAFENGLAAADSRVETLLAMLDNFRSEGDTSAEDSAELDELNRQIASCEAGVRDISQKERQLEAEIAAQQNAEGAAEIEANAAQVNTQIPKPEEVKKAVTLKIAKILKNAEKLFKQMGGAAEFSAEGEKLVYRTGGANIKLVELEPQEQLLVYLSLVLAAKDETGELGGWLVLDEKLTTDIQSLTAALRKLKRSTYYPMEL